jgi:hypothetical protein
MPARKVSKKKPAASKDKAAGDAKPGLLDQILAVFKKKPAAPEQRRARSRDYDQIPPP